MLLRTLKNKTKIAKPTAASEAATVKTNKEKIKPVISFKKIEKKIKFKFIANKDNSIEINVTIIFLL
jgi:hypothetical protein